MKIARKISLSFFVVVLIIMSIAMSIFYRISRDSLRLALYNNLITACCFRSDHIRTYLKMLEVSVEQLSKSVVLENFLKINDKESPRRNDAFEAAMKRLARTKESNSAIAEFLLLDTTGKVVASSNKSSVGLDMSMDASFLGGQKGTYIQDVYYSQIHKEPLMGVSTQFLDSQTGKILGVLVGKVRLNDLYNIIAEKTGMGKTGKIYIVNKYGYMITPSRFKEDVVLKQRVDTRNVELSLQDKDIGHASSNVEKEMAIGVFPDYRGVQVLGVHEYISQMRWSVLTEIDAKEVFEPLAKLRLVFLVILFIMSLAGWVLGMCIARAITDPIHRLHKGTEIIGRGNLDYKIGTDAKDEVGQLSRAFDTMTQDLKKTTTSIDILDKEITERKKVEEESKKTLLWQQGVSTLQQSLLAPSALESKLKTITENIVYLFDVDFCRIWLIRPGDLCEQGCIHAESKEEPHICRYREKCLHLLASSGRYTHIDGKTHRRVPFGCYKIGRVASDEERKFLTNDAQNDLRVHNHEWARELGLVSFAGYQLRVPHGETIGVLALFAKHPISTTEDTILDGISSVTAFVIQRAITEDKLEKSYDKLKQVQAQFIQASKMSGVGSLASGIAHEINNPLTGVLNNVQLIKAYLKEKKDFNADDFTEILDSMEESAKRCVSITRALLDFSHPSKGVFQPAQIKDIVTKVLILIRHELELGNIKIVREIEPNLPEINCDQQLLQQVFFDIIANARWAIQMKSQAEEGGTITIKAKYNADKDTLDLHISDTGIGIPEVNLKRVFEPFFTTKNVGEGSGLGLFLVYNIIKGHKGEIEAQSNLNQGTTLKISLPIA